MNDPSTAEDAILRCACGEDKRARSFAQSGLGRSAHHAYRVKYAGRALIGKRSIL